MKNILVYGAGSAFKDFMAIKPTSVNVKACFSSSDLQENILEIPIIRDIKQFIAIQSDFIVIALRDVESVRRSLIAQGVDEDRIVSFYNSGDNELISPIIRDVVKLNSELGMRLRMPAISNMWMHPFDDIEIDSFDSIRNSSFELMARQIIDRNIKGAIAELGVYRGDQARLISKLFHDKKFYLFDTFEGFSERDLKMEGGESSKKYSESTTLDFTNTSVAEVSGKIHNLERVEFRKGYFPETAHNLDEVFCFVSLDVDLYAPTLAGLEYFYPRLAIGGVIFVHDYNNLRYKGVKSAVDKFQEMTSCVSMPIADCAGSIVILK